MFARCYSVQRKKGTPISEVLSFEKPRMPLTPLQVWAYGQGPADQVASVEGAAVPELVKLKVARDEKLAEADATRGHGGHGLHNPWLQNVQWMNIHLPPILLFIRGRGFS